MLLQNALMSYFEKLRRDGYENRLKIVFLFRVAQADKVTAVIASVARQSQQGCFFGLAIFFD